MIDPQKMALLLERHEGRRQFPYRDSVGKLTIGVGFNLDDVGLHPEEIDFILSNRIELVRTRLLQVLPEYRDMSAIRRMVLIDMVFNLGLTRFLKFKRMLAAIALHDYNLAAEEMLDSKWATQVGGRARRLAEMMREDTWPTELD